MPTGERLPGRRAARGMTYLTLLVALAAMGAAAAAVGESLVRQQQRERERELLFRGAQIRSALLSYRAATPDGQPPLPATLAQLVEDTRHSPPVHHLRRLYADPFTGEPDWIVLRRADGRVTGVRSRSTRPILTGAAQGPPPARAAESADPDDTKNTRQGPAPTVGDWHFAIEPGTAGDDDRADDRRRDP